MLTLIEKTLAACPPDWTDLRDAAQAFPPHEAKAMAQLLEDLERKGEIEVRPYGNPQRLQIRRAAAEPRKAPT